MQKVFNIANIERLRSTIHFCENFYSNFSQNVGRLGVQERGPPSAPQGGSASSTG